MAALIEVSKDGLLSAFIQSSKGTLNNGKIVLRRFSLVSTYFNALKAKS